jgi:hypothetical protein
MKPSARSKEKS